MTETLIPGTSEFPWAPTPAPTPPLAPQPPAAPLPPGPWAPLDQDNTDILAEYRAQYAVREARYAACLEGAAKQRTKRDEEQAEIDKAWNDPTKRRPKKKPKPKTLVKTCKLKHPKIACVPPNQDAMGDFLSTTGTSINNQGGTSIDFNQISAWEGGVYLNAYQPWFPDLTRNVDGSYTPAFDQNAAGNPRLVGPIAVQASAGQPAKRNRSGTSVGKGIDLGPQTNKARYFRELDTANQESNALTPTELQQLKDKIDPYMGKRMAEACIYLRAHPLTMTQKELDLLHYRAAKIAMNDAKRAYFTRTHKTFNELPVEAQTAVFSRVYQTGRPPSDATLDHLAAGNYLDASQGFTREAAYLGALGNAPAAPAHPAPHP